MDGSRIKYPIGRIGEYFKVSIIVMTRINEVSSFKGRTITSSTITKVKGRNLDNYYDVSLYPFIEIDFTNRDDYIEAKAAGVTISGACKITLNKYNLFLFLNKLKKLEEDFITYKDLFYYNGTKLILDKEVAKNVLVDEIIGNKRVMMGPTIVNVGGGEKEHEGIYFALNDLSNITFLTYTEIGYLRFMLEKIDIDILAIELVKLVGENKIVSITHNTAISIDEASTSVKPVEEDNSSSSNVIIKSETVIPSL